MYQRLLKLSLSNSFLLLGPRGSGKSTLLSKVFSGKNAMWVDLLTPELELEYSNSPSLLLERWKAIEPKPEWIVIDEIQKVPSLLDVVHMGIEKHNIKFALTGSSARKLKRGASNLLAGRAFIFNLYPLTSLELANDFELDNCLSWGTLPKIKQFNNDDDKKRFLRSYSLTYLKEEVQTEQLVRRIEPFRRFLEIAAQSNGEILNFSKLGREARIGSKAIERYFEILNDTLLGFYLNAYGTSVRKNQLQKPKFYFFDTGVVRAIQNRLDYIVAEKTYGYGKTFEHFIILECIKLNDYLEKSFSFSYLKTKDGAEIDLIINRPRKTPILAEIKSSTRIDDTDIRTLSVFKADFPNSPRLILCRERSAREINGVRIVPWQQGLKEIFDL